jgi:hypothetical protein
MRIAYNAERSGSLCTGDLDTVVDQRSSDATTPDVRVNEQGIEFDVSIRPGQQRSESTIAPFRSRRRRTRSV